MFQLRGTGFGDVLPSYCTINPYDPSCQQVATSATALQKLGGAIRTAFKIKPKPKTTAPASWGGWDCMINPKDPKCAGKPATTGSNSSTGGGQKPPGTPNPLPGAYPTAGAQVINPATGLPYAPGAINPATGLPYGVAAQPWYTQWWGLALIAGVGYGVYTLVK